jgi:hypothetical protein
VLAAGGCGGDTGQMPDGPRSFAVRVTDGDVGSTSARLPFSSVGRTYTLNITAVPDGSVDSGWVALRIIPGDIVSVEYPGAVQTNVPLVGGRATDVRVTVARAYGDARIWALDLGFVPGPPIGAACNNGRDDDGDGRIDYGDDPGCAFSNDDDEGDGSQAVGLTPTLFFENPRIGDVQGFASESPLLGRTVTIDRGDMVVTRVSVEGLYVTDVTETRGYNHLYAFNFNTPAGVRICDRLTALQGIVGEFYGYTELGYPSWTRDRDQVRPILPASRDECPVPDPTELTAAIMDDARAMESLEAGLVQITDGVITDRFDNCDLNGNGQIDWDTAEEVCRDECDAAADCTELLQYRQYGQFGVTFGTGSAQRKINVVTRDSYPDFDGYAQHGRTVRLLRGTLKQLSFLNIPWILEIRCRDDLTMTGTPPPMWQACVPPPTEDDGYTR